MKGCPQHEWCSSQRGDQTNFAAPSFRAISIVVPLAGRIASIPLLLLVSLSLGWPSRSLHAQEVPSASYEGHPVAEVVLVARPAVNTESLQGLILQKAGEPFSSQKILATLEALRKTNQFTKVNLELLRLPPACAFPSISNPCSIWA
jgi:hypothetical protein